MTRNIILFLSLASLLPRLGLPRQTESSGPDREWTSLYAGILEDYVDDVGLVDYRRLKEDRSRLDAWVSSLANLETEAFSSRSETDRIAFWINAYNGLTLKVIIDHYPIRSSFLKSLRFPKNSIRQIGGVWDKISFQVLGRSLTLDQMEHEILRREFREPRIHMALVCAALSCPPLRKEPYAAEELDEQLDDQTRAFLGRKENFFIDVDKKEIHLSSILNWYKEDFLVDDTNRSGGGGRSAAETAVLRFISAYVSPQMAAHLEDSSYKIKYRDYDWSLNERERP